MRTLFFFFNDTATTEIYTLSLHDALPISSIQGSTDIPTLYHSIHGYMNHPSALKRHDLLRDWLLTETTPRGRSEEHTSELQSRLHLVCRLLLEKKKNITAQSRLLPTTG